MVKFFPSLMCADISNIRDEIRALEDADVDGFHLDLMDGKFVPNFALGLEDIKAIRRLTDKPLDLHLMIDEPEQYIDLFCDINIDMISVHFESCVHIDRVIKKIKNKEKKAGIAINPGTSIDSIKYLLSEVDFILIMSVNPGFAGQSFIDYVFDKVKDLKKIIDKKNHNVEIYADGALSLEKIRMLKSEKVNGFVLGTSVLFNKSKDYSEIINNLRAL
ncbi:ribulose-phosphate 3-epimerase [Maledivibacter halophilus]|uniref:Ribulose-phosphate 3-epimerase n=1 Tax=Maledivibacter halophilus TaxID=36842 RepID=A0A1T5KCT2_9FIRM|nr:ribulose-phosphate 3-epimerase [Maledivibacter halophilus]SKC61430.1 ribulose-5-phosphate 3-epimerase [Maledivibacter halophilus]